MNYIGKFISNFKDFYNEINAATLTGAIDVVVVRQEDGSYHTSPFHVRFGKIGVLRSREKIVDIEINGEPVDIHMKLGESGEAFFVEELEEGSIIDDPQLGTSPVSPSDLLEHLKDLDNLEKDRLKDEHRVRQEASVQFDDFKSQDDSGVEAEDHTYAKPHNSSSRTTAGSVSRSFTDQATELTVDEAIADLSNTFPTQVEKTDNGSLHSEIGVVYRVRKNSGNCECQDMETQTIRPVDVPRKTDGKAMSRSFTEGNGRKIKGSVDGPGSKTDIEDVIKPNKNVRRKRKKRNNKANKGRAKSSGSQSSDNSTTSEVTDPSTIHANNSANLDSIFIMEDIDSDKLPASATSTPNSQLTQSTSLPLLKERTSTGDKDGSGEWSDIMSRSMGPDFHPFSDTDISPPPSPSNSRPPTPIKSDTEYETERTRVADSSSQTDIGKWSWTWGELPTPPPKTPTRKISTVPEGSGGVDNSTSTAVEDHSGNGLQKQSCNTQLVEDEERSMFRGMFSFMRATKKARHNPESEGIYLDDLNLEELDPEVAALYFPRNFRIKERTNGSQGSKDEDVESGNGPSLPHSPHSVEGAIGGPKILSDSESEEPRHPIFDYRGYHDIAFSRCGCLPDYVEKDYPESIFMQNLVTYDDFCENPNIFDDPDLVIRFGGKYFNWKTAAPQIMSLVLFQRPVPTKLKEDLLLEHMPKKEPIRKRTESKGLSWFSWRRGNQEDDEKIEDDTETDKSQESPKVICDLEVPVGVGDAGLIEVTSHETQTSLPGTPIKEKMHNRKVGQDSSESEDIEESKDRHPSGERYKKSLRLTSEQIQKLGLKDGRNEVVFSVTTAYQGTSRCKCHIFLWNYDDKIVVSDIDGTITKSDVLGHILPIIGKDWAQSGVAQLFTKIKNNGYHFLYLSARAIGQAHITREYLKSIKQGDLSLPDGPLLLNPTSLVNAFHREVIEKKPEEFKISCLRDVQKLFPEETNGNPFYAGYGNRINDVWAYKHVGIPISRIFTINHRGELRHELTQAFQSSYHNLSDIAHHMFPPLPHQETLGEFSSLQYWRPQLPDVSAEIEAILAQQ